MTDAGSLKPRSFHFYSGDTYHTQYRNYPKQTLQHAWQLLLSMFEYLMKHCTVKMKDCQTTPKLQVAKLKNGYNPQHCKTSSMKSKMSSSTSIQSKSCISSQIASKITCIWEKLKNPLFSSSSSERDSYCVLQ